MQRLFEYETIQKDIKQKLNASIRTPRRVILIKIGSREENINASHKGYNKELF